MISQGYYEYLMVSKISQYAHMAGIILITKRLQPTAFRKCLAEIQLLKCMSIICLWTCTVQKKQHIQTDRPTDKYVN